ncbi:MAG: hypothetical protein WC685_02040 [Methylobacter sp.]|jgi:hypothetical protein
MPSQRDLAEFSESAKAMLEVTANDPISANLTIVIFIFIVSKVGVKLKPYAEFKLSSLAFYILNVLSPA